MARSAMPALLLALVVASCSTVPSSSLATPSTDEAASHGTGTLPTMPSDDSSAAATTSGAGPSRGPSSAPTSAPTKSAAPAPVTFQAGDIAIVTATDGVRMRTKPSTGSDSERYTPLLPAGTDLYVLSGPVTASGHRWYEVSPISFRVTGLVEYPATSIGAGATGWVPAASEAGEAWLGHGEARCPSPPGDAVSLAQLSVGARLGCFSRVPITLKAKLVPCNCDVDGPAAIEPAMFQRHGWWGVKPSDVEPYGGGEPVLVNTDTPTPLTKAYAWLDPMFLYLDPKGAFPARSPVATTVSVTGMFDHPAAARCRLSLMEPDPLEPSDVCRYDFVLTAIK